MLQPIARSAAVALVALTAACGEPVAPAPHGLDGSWMGPSRTYVGSDPAKPRVELERLDLMGDVYQRHISGYGAGGRPITERTSYHGESGYFTVSEGEIRFMPMSGGTTVWVPENSGGVAQLGGTYVARFERGDRSRLLVTYLRDATPEAVEYHRAGTAY
jgi:hypothetical protein